MAKSELFTENFMVPVAAVVAKDARVKDLIRLWLATLAMNLAAAWIVTALLIRGFPELGRAAKEIAAHPASQHLGTQALANAVIAGAAITLMTWIERSTESVTAKLVSAIAIAFLLVGGRMDHSIVGSVEMFSALHSGAVFGYSAWARFVGIALAGNLVGGLGLVTVLRLVQVGGAAIRAEQERDPTEPREGQAS